MKYFEKFLADNESGYDDIDISVHCDVEIFEWLMNYIHNKVGEEGRTAVVNLAGNSPNSPNKSQHRQNESRNSQKQKTPIRVDPR